MAVKMVDGTFLQGQSVDLFLLQLEVMQRAIHTKEG
jgi:hypothetical protein